MMRSKLCGPSREPRFCASFRISGPIFNAHQAASMSSLRCSHVAGRAHRDDRIISPLFPPTWLPLHHGVRVARPSLLAQSLPREEAATEGRLNYRAVYSDSRCDGALHAVARQFARGWCTRERHSGNRLGSSWGEAEVNEPDWCFPRARPWPRTVRRKDACSHLPRLPSPARARLR